VRYSLLPFFSVINLNGNELFLTDCIFSLLLAAHSYVFNLLSSSTGNELWEGFARYIAICRLLENIECYISETELLTLSAWGDRASKVPDVRFLKKHEIEFSRVWFSFLKDLGVDINAVETVTDCGWSWLLAATIGGDLGLIHALVCNGADVRSRTPDGMSVLHYAFAHWGKDLPSQGGALDLYAQIPRRDQDLVALLALFLTAGCDPHARSASGTTPLVHARSTEKTQEWFAALAICGYDLREYLAVEFGRLGVSTSLDMPKAFGSRPSRRHAHAFDDA